MHKQLTERLKAAWSKPLQNLPVAKDFPRLCRKFQLFHYDPQQEQYIEQQLPYSDPETSTYSYELLNQLNKNLSEKQPTEDLNKKEYLNTVNLEEFQTINEYLLKKFGDDGKVTKVLKACNQAIVIVLLIIVKVPLQRDHKINFKDCMGEWKILIHTNSNKTSVTHRRREEVFEKQDRGLIKSTFQFEWEMELEFDKNFQFSNVEVRFLKPIFKKEEDNELYKNQLSILKQFFNLNGKQILENTTSQQNQSSQQNSSTTLQNPSLQQKSTLQPNSSLQKPSLQQNSVLQNTSLQQQKPTLQQNSTSQKETVNKVDQASTTAQATNQTSWIWSIIQ